MGRDNSHYTRLLKAPSSLALGTARDEAPRASLSKLLSVLLLMPGEKHPEHQELDDPNLLDETGLCNEGCWSGCSHCREEKGF